MTTDRTTPRGSPAWELVEALAADLEQWRPLAEHPTSLIDAEAALAKRNADPLTDHEIIEAFHTSELGLSMLRACRQLSEQGGHSRLRMTIIATQLLDFIHEILNRA